MNSHQKKTILILSANPKDMYRLRSDEEIRKIKNVLERSSSSEAFAVAVELATPVAELQALFLKHRPQIVHFCGHGEEDGLLFEDESSKKQQVPVNALADLFKLCKQSIECVVLNACYSQAQAESIHQHIPCVVGMQSAIGDKAATLFATGFYTALGNGRSYREAYEFGCNRIGLHNLPEDSTPVILARDEAIEQPVVLSNPYRGLSAFREEDEAYFFGRETYTTKILDAMRQSPFTAILGASGSGKSSLIYAGVIPYLRRGEHTSPENQDAADWMIISLRPGEHPFKTISVALLPFLEPDLGEVDRLVEINKLTEALQAGHLSFSDLLERIQTKHSSPYVLLFIDQFEEIFSLCDDAKERRNFLDKLLESLQHSESTKLSVIITLRSDFLGHCNSHPKLSHLIANHEIIIPAMNEDELRRAIAEPANVAGQLLSEEVVDLLIEQSAGREGALPLLEFALTRIWEGMTNGVVPADTLKQIGGVGGALANKAQDLFDNLNETEQQIARRAFLAMVRLGEGTKDTRRRINVTDIVSYKDTLEQVRRVLNHFAHPGARLITLAEDSAEITHEALFDHWDALKSWLDDSRDDLRFHRRLAAAVQHWDINNRHNGLLWRPPDLELLQQYHQRNQRDMTALQMEFLQESEQKEKQTKLWKNFIAAVLAILTVVSVIGATLAVQSGEKAKKSEQLAKAERKKAEVNEIDALNQTAKALFASHDELNALLTAVRAGIKVKKIEKDVSTALNYHTGFNVEDILSMIEQKNRIEWFEGREECMMVTSISPNGLLAASTISADFGKESVKLFDLPTKTFRILNTNSEQIKNISFSPDNRFFAVGEPKAVTIYTVNDLMRFKTFKGNFTNGGSCTNDNQVEFSSDGKLLAMLAYNKNEPNSIGWNYQDARIELWDIFSGSLIKTFDAFGIRSIQFSPDNQMLALIGCNAVKIIRIADEYEIFSLKETEVTQDRAPCMPAIFSFSPDSKFFTLGDRQGLIKVFDTTGTSPIKIKEWHAHSSGIGSLIFSSDSQWVVSGSNDEIKIWEVATWKVLKTLESDLIIRDIGLNQDKTKLFSISNDGFVSRQCIEEWDITDKAFESVYFNLVSHFGNYASFPQFNGDGTRFAVGLSSKWTDKTTNVEKVHVAGILLQKTEDKFEEITHLCTPSYSNSYATLNDEKLISLFYNYDKEKLIRSAGNLIITHNLKTSQQKEIKLKGIFITLSPKGNVVALKRDNNDNDIQLWNLNDNEELAVLENAISNNDTGTVVVWSFSEEASNSLEALDEFELSRKTVFSTNEELLATSNRNTIKLWDVFTGKLIKTFNGHSDTVLTLTFASDDRILVSGGNDRFIKLWDVQKGHEILSLHTPSGIENIAISPNGKILAAKYVNRVIQLWDLEQQREIATLPSTFTSSPFIYWLRFTPDGKALVLGGAVGINFFPLDILDDILQQSCEWLQDYLNNPYANLSDEDRSLCDEILVDRD